MADLPFSVPIKKLIKVIAELICVPVSNINSPVLTHLFPRSSNYYVVFQLSFLTIFYLLVYSFSCSPLLLSSPIFWPLSRSEWTRQHATHHGPGESSLLFTPFVGFAADNSDLVILLVAPHPVPDTDWGVLKYGLPGVSLVNEFPCWGREAVLGPSSRGVIWLRLHVW